MDKERQLAGPWGLPNLETPEKLPLMVQRLISKSRSEAERFDDHYDLAGKIGLAYGNNERLILRDNFAIRLLRAKSYDASFLSRLPFVSKRYIQIDKDCRMAESKLREVINNVSSQGSEKEKTIFRTIELAVNDLAARSTIREMYSTEIFINRDTVENWYRRWDREIKSLR